MADRVGQQLGNYRLIRELGEGAFATVYLGEHIHLGSQAAIKVLQTHLADKELEQFLSEARTIAHLEHPHIVRVLEFGVEGSTPFLAMSYARLGTLRTRHPKGCRLALGMILPYVRQVAAALQYAHSARLVHRDVKPENMLLGEHGQLWLSDFGIAVAAHSSQSQSTQEVAGSVGYMAPEQLQGYAQPASDQYALGIVVYEWLTGARPFQGSFMEVATQHVLKPPPPLRERVSMLSPLVEQVVLTALNKDPRARFASVQAFTTALEQAYQEQPFPFAALPVDQTADVRTTPMGTGAVADDSTRPDAGFATLPHPPAAPPTGPQEDKPAGSAPQPVPRRLTSSNRFYALLLLGLAAVVMLGGLGRYFFTRQQAPVGKRLPRPPPRCSPPGITEFDLSFDEPAGITVGPDGNIWFTAVDEQPQVGIPCCDIGHMTLTGVWVPLPLPSGHQAKSIVTGPDGNLRFTEPKNHAIGRMTSHYQSLPDFPLPAGSAPSDITLGPDGNLWFTEDNTGSSAPGKIGRITPQGKVTEFGLPITRSNPQMITTGPDGNLWFTDAGRTPQIGRITPTGQIFEFVLPPAGLDDPQGITKGPDGNLWFADKVANRIGRITPHGDITEFSLPAGESTLGGGLVAGPDGNLWFTDAGYPAKIGRISPSGKVISEFAISTGASDPAEIIVGPHDSLWFTDLANSIGRVLLGNQANPERDQSAEPSGLGQAHPGLGASFFAAGARERTRRDRIRARQKASPRQAETNEG